MDILRIAKLITEDPDILNEIEDTGRDLRTDVAGQQEYQKFRDDLNNLLHYGDRLNAEMLGLVNQARSGIDVTKKLQDSRTSAKAVIEKLSLCRERLRRESDVEALNNVEDVTENLTNISNVVDDMGL